MNSCVCLQHLIIKGIHVVDPYIITANRPKKAANQRHPCGTAVMLEGGSLYNLIVKIPGMRTDPDIDLQTMAWLRRKPLQSCRGE